MSSFDHHRPAQADQVLAVIRGITVEAMSQASERSRDLLISTAEDKSDGVLVAVRDSGPGLSPESIERLFDPFAHGGVHGRRQTYPTVRAFISASPCPRSDRVVT